MLVLTLAVSLSLKCTWKKFEGLRLNFSFRFVTLKNCSNFDFKRGKKFVAQSIFSIRTWDHGFWNIFFIKDISSEIIGNLKIWNSLCEPYVLRTFPDLCIIHSHFRQVRASVQDTNYKLWISFGKLRHGILLVLQWAYIEKNAGTVQKVSLKTVEFAKFPTRDNQGSQKISGNDAVL